MKFKSQIVVIVTSFPVRWRIVVFPLQRWNGTRLPAPERRREKGGRSAASSGSVFSNQRRFEVTEKQRHNLYDIKSDLKPLKGRWGHLKEEKTPKKKKSPLLS